MRLLRLLTLAISILVLSVPGQERARAATPAQGRLVLATTSAATLRGLGSSAIWLATPDGTARRLLGRANASALVDPALSPDGSHIAYVRDGQELWQMASDGSQARMIYAIPINIYSRIMAPRYAPDGQTIAFTSGCCGNFSIDTISLHGGHVDTLLRGGLRVFQDWSPDRKQILYIQNGALWTADTHGRHTRALGGDAPDAGSFLAARYSPDGSHLAAALRPAQGTEAAATAIVLLHPDGQYLTFLTSALPYDVGVPSWSADGKWISFVATSGAESALGRKHDLWIMRYDGSQKRNVTRGTLGDVVQAGWAR